MKKEKWGKPKLIVLVRSKPEEGVLVACKRAAVVNLGPGRFDLGCFRRSAIGPWMPCDGLSAS